jgi:hypothetical protein
MKMHLSGEWLSLRGCEQSLPRTTKAKLSSLLHAAHWQWEMPHKDPEVQLMAELSPRVCMLQERIPGARAQVPSHKLAQSSCWHSPRQLLNGKLAGANKAKAASQPESLMLVLTSFLGGTHKCIP